MIRISVDDAELYRHAIRWTEIPPWLDEELGVLALDVERNMKQNTPVRTGLTRASIETKKPRDLRYEVGSWTRGNILRFLDRGVAPHVILPRTRRALRWINEDTGDVVFAARVFHPGIEAMRIAESSVEPAWRDFLVRIEKRLKEENEKK